MSNITQKAQNGTQSGWSSSSKKLTAKDRKRGLPTATPPTSPLSPRMPGPSAPTVTWNPKPSELASRKPRGRPLKGVSMDTAAQWSTFPAGVGSTSQQPTMDLDDPIECSQPRLSELVPGSNDFPEEKDFTVKSSSSRPPFPKRHGVSRFNAASANPTRFWLGTYYPTADESEQYLADGTIPSLRLDYEREDVTCWRGQWEYGGKGDKDGKLHCQFAVAYRDQVRAPQARRIIGGQYGPFTGFLEPAFSKNVWDYVTKVDSRVQAIEGYGNLTDDTGHRSDLDIIYAEIAQGTPIYDIMSRFPRQFMRNHAAISKVLSRYKWPYTFRCELKPALMYDLYLYCPQLCAMYDKPRPYGKCTVEIWWGVTGSGKSHKAFHEYPEAYRKSIPGKWWEGYRGESVVVFEEFNPNEDKELRLPELLKILDKYPYQVEIKGASMQLKANHFIFTTNIDPRTWYEGHPQVPAFCRRVDKIVRFTLNRQDQEETGLSGVLEFPGMQALEKDLLS